MQNFLQYFDSYLKVYLAGVVSYPVGMYLLTRFGGAVWEDVKKIAYSIWDKVRSKV